MREREIERERGKEAGSGRGQRRERKNGSRDLIAKKHKGRACISETSAPPGVRKASGTAGPANGPEHPGAARPEAGIAEQAKDGD